MSSTTRTRGRASPDRRTIVLVGAVLINAVLVGWFTDRATAQNVAPLTIEASPDSALANMLAQLQGEPLALTDAIGEALHRDTAVATARAELEAARGAERREGGFFDPELYGEAERYSDSQPTASFFAGADVLETTQTRAEAGARMLLPFGTELSASLNTSRLSTNSAFATLSPQYDTFGQIELVQPLLRGFGPGTSGDRDAARRNVEAAEARYEDARLVSRAEVETTYWALYAAERDLAVQSLIRDRGQAFLDDVRLRAQVGSVGPSEVANARVFLAQQEQVVLDTEEALDRLSDHLVTLMGRRPTGGVERFRAADRPPTEVAPIARDRLVDLVMTRSLEVAAAEQNLAAVRARSRGASWNALPRLDLFGHLGGRGLAGTGRDLIIDFGEGEPDTIRNSLDTGFSDSFNQVIQRDFPTWSVGMRFVIPIGGGAVAGERDRLRAEVIRAEQNLEEVRRLLFQDVRKQHRELERGLQRLVLANEGIDASLEQVRIGSLQFASGRVTAFELVRLAADLADAQRRYSEALVRTARAAATLRRLTAGAYPSTGPLDPGGEGSTP